MCLSDPRKKFHRWRLCGSASTISGQPGFTCHFLEEDDAHEEKGKEKPTDKTSLVENPD